MLPRFTTLARIRRIKRKLTAMEPYSNKKPAIPQGWLRALLFMIFYFAILLALSVIIILIFKNTGNGETKAVNNSLVLYTPFIINAVLSILIVWAFRKLIDRKTFSSLGFDFDKQGAHAAVGFFLGVLILCVGTLILYFTHHLQWIDINFNANDLFISFGLMVIVAFYEEIVFRGYILNNLLSSLSKWTALLISALLFALAHAANPGYSMLAAVNIFLAGVLLGINYIYTKNLWFAILLHFSWNFFQGPVLGYEVSGLNLQSIFQHEIHGSELITGGKFGFEGSLLASLLYIMAIGGLAWVYRLTLVPSKPHPDLFLKEKATNTQP
jgi:uncharacterized protein